MSHTIPHTAWKRMDELMRTCYKCGTTYETARGLMQHIRRGRCWDAE